LVIQRNEGSVLEMAMRLKPNGEGLVELEKVVDILSEGR
jgi:hypothetical protein